MQNEPNFQKSQMNINLFITMDYENKRNWTLGENEPNQTQLKPIKAKTNPIKANFCQFLLKNAKKSQKIRAFFLPILPDCYKPTLVTQFQT